MARFTEGPLRRALAAGFKGHLSTGIIRRYTYTMNSFGDRVPSGHTDYTFEGIRDDFNALYRAQAGIPDSDVRVMVILGLVKPPTTPVQTDKIFIKNQWHEVRQVLEIDPADATAKLQCYKITSET